MDFQHDPTTAAQPVKLDFVSYLSRLPGPWPSAHYFLGPLVYGAPVSADQQASPRATIQILEFTSNFNLVQHNSESSPG